MSAIVQKFCKFRLGIKTGKEIIQNRWKVLFSNTYLCVDTFFNVKCKSKSNLKN